MLDGARDPERSLDHQRGLRARQHIINTNEGCRQEQRKASAENFFKPFPKETDRQEEGAALESTPKPWRARGDSMACSQYTQLDLIGRGSVLWQVAHIVRFGYVQECRLEQARLAARVWLSIVPCVADTSIRQHRTIALGMNWLRAVASFRP